MAETSPDGIRDDETDDASCLSYFSSFNRQSFETGNTDHVPGAGESAPATELPADLQSPDGSKVPHPPMRSTLTPIAIAMPPPNLSPPPTNTKKPARKRTTPKGSDEAKPPSPSPLPPPVTTGPIAALVQQHNHTVATQLRTCPQSSSPAIPTIILQPMLLNLTPEQQQIAAQLQDQFFRLISNAGQNCSGPLAVVAPNLAALQPPPQHNAVGGSNGFAPFSGLPQHSHRLSPSADISQQQHALGAGMLPPGMFTGNSYPAAGHQPGFPQPQHQSHQSHQFFAPHQPQHHHPLSPSQ